MTIEVDKLAGPSGGDESRRLAKHWLDQINAIKDNAEYKRWVKRSEAIIKRYRDERSRVDEDGQRRYNALWANTEVLKPAFYGRTPLPVAERRFRDKDPTGRCAAQILERALRNEIEVCGFSEAMNQAVSDYLLPGRGTVWIRYEPEIEESVSLPPDPQTDMKDAQGDIQGIQTDDDKKPKRERPTLAENDRDEEDEESEEPEQEDEKPDEEEGEQKLMDTGDRIIRESTPVDFVPWDDFFTFPIRARSWAEVTAVAKRVYMSRMQMRKRFGDEIGKKIPLQKDDRGDKTQNTTLQAQEQDKGQVFEVWSKEDESVYWVAQGYDFLADRKDDPLELENFFPCPKPLFANPTTNTIIPVPDFIQYQDQAIQIDELTQRIAMLAKACKVAGVYNAAAKDIQRLLNESVENELIPVDDWAAFAEKQGVEGNISFLPIQDIMAVIDKLMIVKQQQIEEMDRLTGINDIMRGTSDARETLGGVRIKSNSTGTRLTSRQNEVARFARDTLRIMADIMAQHFSPQSLIEVSGALYEEGLGPKDMPSLTAIQQAQEWTPKKPPQQNGPGGPPPPPQTPQAPGGATPGSPPPQAGAPPLPSGGNVVPFRGPQPPPQQPPGPPQPGAPPQGPQQPPGPVQPPPLPPEVQAKIDSLQRISEAIKLLRDERLRGFRVDIEVDSTIYGDQAQDKQDRNEFVTAVTGFLEQSMMIGQSMPESIPLLGKLLQFAARGHKVGRDLETSIEEFTEEATIIAKQKQSQAASQPNPEQMKMQLEAQKAQLQLQVQQSKAQSDQMRNQAEMQSTHMKSQSEGQQAQAEVQRQGIENQGDMINAQANQQKAQSDMQMQQLQMQIEHMKLQIEYAKLKAMGEQTQQAQAATQQSQHATEQTQHQGQADLAVEQEHTKQVADQEHTKRVAPQPIAAPASPASGQPRQASAQPAQPRPAGGKPRA